MPSSKVPTGRSQPPPSVRKPATQRPPCLRELAKQMMSKAAMRNEPCVNNLQVYRLEISPLTLQIFNNQSAMTVFRRGFTAEQCGREGEVSARHTVLDFTLRHQSQELPFVLCPNALFLLIGVQHFLRWRQEWFMHIFRLAYLSQKILQVVTLGESRQL